MPDQNRAAAAELQRYLRGVSYPTSKGSLREKAQENGAPEEVLRLIEALPGQEFGGPQEVMKAYGEEKTSE